MRIRAETGADRAPVHELNTAAFGGSAEAEIVDLLREAGAASILLVAEDGGKVVGHICFSRVELVGFPGLKIAGLAPVAVRPDRQRQGIGSRLIREGLEKCREAGFGAVVVLGHPEYYPRFGFVRAKNSGITCEFGPCDDSFMLLEVEPGYLRGASGLAKYHPAFRVA